MAVDNYFILAMANGMASVAPQNTAYPGTLTALNSPWVDLGAISEDGLTEDPSETRTEFKRWGSISVFQSVITDQKKTFKVKFLESNPNVLGLWYKNGGPLVPSGAGTNEVQTITITGTPTGGTFSLTYNNATTGALAYNITTTALQTALQALSTIGASNVTVTGTAGVSYVLTFTGTLATTNVPNVVAVGSFTGGTTPTIAVTATTGGATGQIMSITDDTTGKRDVRAMCFDVLQGTNHFRFYCPTAEVTDRGGITYVTNALVAYDMTITAYPDSTGVAVKRDYLLDAVVQGL